MEQQQADVVVTVGDEASRDLAREKVARAGFQTVWSQQQIAVKKLTLAQFVRYDHALVSYRGASESALDRELQRQGTARHVRYVTPHFASLPLLLKQLPLFATVPQGLVASWREHYDLQAAPVPVSMPDYELSLLWHHAQHDDPANQWLRDRVRSVLLQRAA